MSNQHTESDTRNKQEASTRLLVVEPSSTMRYVLDNYLQELGYDSVALDDYREAQSQLRSQFDNFSPAEEYSCVLLGWQTARNADANRFLSLLESPDFRDLPAIVLSQETRADSRAWVAGRSQTTLLRWKDYKSVRERLTSLLDRSLDTDGARKTVKFANGDISILVVDDSASIRFALRDLLELHGYRVTVVSSHSEAMTTARSQSFDIAVLDYYLQDSTGDDLCRELIEETAVGDITCAILTGTYSDHIITSSLRAGAIECMFKNESGELLLARIDAISRMVRQKKSLLGKQRRLDGVIDFLSGPTLLLDKENKVEFATDSALEILGYTASDSLVTGRSLGDEVELYSGINNRRGTFIGANRRKIPIVYSCKTIEHAADAGELAVQSVITPSKLVTFKRHHTAGDMFENDNAMSSGALSAPRDAASSRGVAGASSAVSQGMADEGQIPVLTDKPAANGLAGTSRNGPGAYSQNEGSAAVEFTRKLQALLGDAKLRQAGDQDTSLLLVEFAFHDGQQLKPITASPERLKSFEKSLSDAYPTTGDIAYFGSSRFGMMLRHRDLARALMQTRKLMQACNQFGEDVGLTGISCMGALSNLELHAAQRSDDVLAYLHRSVSRIAQESRNMVLLADHDKMLKVYPEAALA